jgi:hypothetical protein
LSNYHGIFPKEDGDSANTLKKEKNQQGNEEKVYGKLFDYHRNMAMCFRKMEKFLRENIFPLSKMGKILKRKSLSLKEKWEIIKGRD